MVLRVGLVVNPVAGLGGAVGLNGSDEPTVRAEALRRGGRARSTEMAVAAVTSVAAAVADVQFVSVPGPMGAEALTAAGLPVETVGEAPQVPTDAHDTMRAATALAPLVDVLLFSGGDGTARDLVVDALDGLPVLGIPGGVKMQSSVFATSARAVGEVLAAYARGSGRLERREVVDLDEAARRSGVLTSRLYGSLTIPVVGDRVQSRKLGMSDAPWGDVETAAAAAARLLKPEVRYALAPGTTVSALAVALGTEKSLLGVDVVEDGRTLAREVSDTELLRLLRPGDGIVTSPLGGQGFLFGRGDQQIGARALARVGRAGIVCVAAEGKLASLGGRPLLVDSGDPDVDRALSGYLRCVVGPGRSVMYPVRAA